MRGPIPGLHLGVSGICERHSLETATALYKQSLDPPPLLFKCLVLRRLRKLTRRLLARQEPSPSSQIHISYLKMGLLRISLALLATLGHTAAEGISEHCDAECRSAFHAAFAVESKQWVNNDMTADSFYSNPSNISEYAAGDIVRWEDLSEEDTSTIWSIPGGMSFSRFLYMTVDAEGTPIPASAFVLLPFANPHGADEPLRTVVWTHGTAGGVRKCAPSNHRALYYEWEGPFALVQQGFAVIAPDYAGLGSDIPQGFMYEAGTLHAEDAVFSLLAARQVLGDLISHEWVVVGHSEGGLSAWRTNEREAREGKATSGFLGAVSLAPALRPLELIPESFELADGGPVRDVVSIYFLQSLTRIYPDLHAEDYFSDTVLARIKLADKACLRAGGGLFGDLTMNELYKNTSWLSHPDVLDWDKRYNNPGPHPLAGPMLVVQGVDDPLTYASFTEDDFNKTCEEYPESRAELALYEKLNHDVAAQASQAEYIRWINDRFENVPVEKGCKWRRVKPATERFSKMQQYWEATSNWE